MRDDMEQEFRIWLSKIKGEYPFVRLDMTQEEYDEEFIYYMDSYDERQKGTYMSLYDQKNQLKENSK